MIDELIVVIRHDKLRSFRMNAFKDWKMLSKTGNVDKSVFYIMRLRIGVYQLGIIC